jgi:hypothetical protein
MMKKITIISVILFVFALYVQSQIIYVKQDATGSNDGTSWSNAYTDLQSALASATAGNTIWVAAGTYKPSVPSGTYATFQMIKQVEMYGGFSGTETLLSQRDYLNNKTILSGDIGVIDDITDNVNHVICGIDSTKIDGFIIQDGYANSQNDGGGMYNYDAGNDIENLSIINCTFKNNYAKNTGMALYNSHVVNMLISNCIFKNNNHTNTANGGAIYNNSSTLSINNCNFNNNTSENGGAIFNNYSNATITNCEFIANTCNTNGGAINDYLCASKIFNTVFSFNSAHNYGGGIYTYAPANTHDSITNCTFFHNYGKTKGGAIVDYDLPTVITNSIFMQNASDEPIQIQKTFFNITGTYSAIVNYSCIYANSYTGTGNISKDPKFIDNNTDWHIQPGSPCIDAGNGDYASTLDKNNNNRYDDIYTNNTGVGTPNYTDMGAYECQQNSPLHGTYTIGSTGDFQTFNEAIDTLISLGISDAVTFNVENSTYNEQVIIPAINGVASNSTITFQSASGDSTNVVLTYSGDYTILLNSANYIKFNKITIKTTGTDKAIYFNNCASNNTFNGNIIIGENSTDNLVYSSSSSYNLTPDSNIVFSNNLFVNGKNAVYIERGTKKVYINSNNFINQSSNAVFAYYADVSEINGNYFNSYTAYTAINIVNTDNLCKSISTNKIICKYGTLNESCLRVMVANNSNDTSLISNNFIYLNTTNADKAIYLYYTKTAFEIINNTIHVAGNNTGSYCLYTNESGTNRHIVNNNFANFAGGQAMYNKYIPNSDYNNFYTTDNTLLNGKDLESWQYYFHQDSNSISVNPYFVTDTSWQVQSIFLNNSGIPVDNVITDIEGDPRDVSTPDIGADEFTPPYSSMHGIYTIGGAADDFATIQGAVDTLDMRGVDGTITFKIADGTYNEQVVIPAIYGTSETNTVIFTSASSDSSKVILTFSPDVSGSDKYILKLLRTAYIVFDKITITNGNEGTTPVVLKSVNNITFSNNVIKAFSSNDNLISIDKINSFDSDKNNLAFTGNYFTHGNMSIRFSYTSSVTISNNKFTDIQTVASYYSLDNSLISGNIINAKLTSNNTVIRLGKDSKIVNNVIYVDNSNNYSCTAVTVGKNSLSAFNNIVIDGGGQSYCILLSYDSCSVYNNILHSEEYCVRVNDTSGLKMNNNVYYSLNRGNYVIFALNDYRSLEQWQNNFHFDSASVIQKIEFNNDTTLYAKSSWLNNTGIPVNGVTTDINGKLRNSATPDIGAYELDITAKPLSGIYTVGNGGHFASLSQVNDSLKICGVKDSVIFNINAGTYNDRIILQTDSIERYPKDAKIVYQSASGDNSSVILTYNSGDENNKIIYLDSIDNVTIKNLTIEAPEDNTTKAVVANRICNNITFENNIVKNGKYGFILLSGNNSYSTNVNIANNIFTNQYYNAIYVKGTDLSKINGNTIKHNSPVQDTAWIGIAALNFAQGGNSSFITNNMISFNATGKSAGIHMYNCNYGYVNVLFNNVNIYGEAENSRALNVENSYQYRLNIYNNIFINRAKGLVIYGSVNKSNYNNMATNGEKFIYISADNYYTSLSDWQYKSHVDENSTGYYSVFVSDTDLHLKNYILTGKASSNYSTAIDFDGELRDTSYLTIGADKPTLNYSLPLSGVYTVGNSGDFGSLPEATYAMGINGINGSVVFKILSGTYNDQLDLFYVKNISSDDTITFESQSGNKDDVTIKYNAESPVNIRMIPFDNFLFRIKNVKNIAIKNLTLQALDSLSNRIIVIEDSVKDVTISGNNIIGFKDIQYAVSDDDNSVCIQLNGKYNTPHIKIVGNNIKYNSAAIRDYTRWNNNADFLKSITIEGNTIFESGVYIYKSKQASIIKNTMSNNKVSTSDIFIRISADSAVVAYNNFNYNSNNYPNFNLLEINTPVSIFNNFISFNNQEAINYKLISLNNQNSILFNNTIYCFGTRENSNSSNLVQLSDNAVAKNNIIVNTSNGKALMGGISDYNDIYPNLDERQAAGNDIHSVSFIPNFVSDTDLHTNSVLLYQKGIAIPAITEDIDGETRNNPPCIGADEFTAPEFEIGDTVTYCYYNNNFNTEEYIYDIGSGYDSYQWSNGSDSSSVLINKSTAELGINNYSVTVTVNGESYNDTLTVNYDLPQALLIDKYCFVSGDTINISAAEAVLYRWNTGDTTQTIAVTTNNNYSVTVTDNYGCKNRDTVEFEVNNYIANINPDVDTICKDKSIELNAVNFANDNIYELCKFVWSTSDTTNSIIFNANDYGVGSHKIYVDVTNKQTSLQCVSSDTAVIIVDECSGINENQKLQIVIYPNPAKDFITISRENYQDKMIMSLTDINGKQIYYSEKNNYAPLQKIDVRYLPEGIYLLKITVNNKIYTNKIIIRRSL